MPLIYMLQWGFLYVKRLFVLDLMAPNDRNADCEVRKVNPCWDASLDLWVTKHKDSIAFILENVKK